MSTARLPIGWVLAGQGIPRVCARHGQPAVVYHRIALSQARPRSVRVPVLTTAYSLDVHILDEVLNKLGKAIVAPTWPFCTRCVAYRSRVRIAGWTLCGLGPATLIEAAIIHLAGGPSAGLVLAAIGLLLTLAGAGFVGESRWPAMSRAYLSDDRQWVHVIAAEPFNRVALALQGGSWIGFSH